jgi:hypothetical protein
VNQDDETSRDRAWYASKAAALEGRRVLEVVYWDVHGFADEPRTWDYGDWHHGRDGCRSDHRRRTVMRAVD